MAIRVAFTGTSHGMKPRQQTVLRDELRRLQELGAWVFFHGDCVGADAQAHQIAVEVGYRHIESFPGDTPGKQAHCRAHRRRPVAPNLKRNVQLVAEADYLVGCPRLNREELRSGTWHTIRRARAQQRDHTIIWPDGQLERHSYNQFS